MEANRAVVAGNKEFFPNFSSACQTRRRYVPADSAVMKNKLLNAVLVASTNLPGN
jgi:hypothetical protein